jgi:peptidoglycan L-alanyl-D-glutamate endopeptidase CwlK
MADRRIESLIPEMQELYKKFAYGMSMADIDYIVTCTARTQAEQDALFAQGRTMPGKKVTWTRNSKHIGGKAFDIVIMEHGKPMWDTKHPGWRIAGNIGESVGLEWGGSWEKSKDFPHFQLKEG